MNLLIIGAGDYQGTMNLTIFSVGGTSFAGRDSLKHVRIHINRDEQAHPSYKRFVSCNLVKFNRDNANNNRNAGNASNRGGTDPSSHSKFFPCVQATG